MAPKFSHRLHRRRPSICHAVRQKRSSKIILEPELGDLFDDEGSYTPSAPISDTSQQLASDSPSPISSPKKTDTTKPTFFDLPTELRLEICSHLVSALNDKKPAFLASTRELIPPLTNTDPAWRPYLRELTALQLVSRLFQHEFLQAWAENSIFLLPIIRDPRHCNSKRCPNPPPFFREPDGIGISAQLMTFLRTMDPHIRAHARRFELIQLDGPPHYPIVGNGNSFNVSEGEMEHYTLALQRLHATTLPANLERVSDVHPEVELRVTVALLPILPSWHRARFAMTDFLFRQVSQHGRSHKGEWSCIARGPVVGRRLDSCWWGDGWKERFGWEVADEVSGEETYVEGRGEVDLWSGRLPMEELILGPFWSYVQHEICEFKAVVD